MSAGIGLRWKIIDNIRFEGHWGQALKNFDYEGEWDLQNEGVHLSLKVDLP